MNKQSPQSPPSYVTELPTEIWIPAVKAAPRRSGCGWFVLGFVAFFAMMLLGGGTAVYGLYYQSDFILPGVYTLNVHLGNQTEEEAAATLKTVWEQKVITLVAGDQSWNVSPASLGITLDAKATAVQAHEFGRSWASLGQIIRSGQISVAPVWQIDLAQAEITLTTLAPEAVTQPVNAGLQMVNGRIEPTAAIAGQELDIAASIQQLSAQAAQAVLDGRFELATLAIPAPITDTTAQANQANALLNQTLQIHAFDPVRNETADWEITPDVWGPWLVISIENQSLSVAVDETAVTDYLNAQLNDSTRYFEPASTVESISNAIHNTTSQVNLRIYHTPTQHIVQAGDSISRLGYTYGIPYPWIQQANPDVSSLSVGQVITIPSPDDLIPLPVVENKRLVVSISEQKLWAYENGTLKWEWPTSTGIASSPTSPGVFQIQSHEENAYAGNWNLWMPYFMGIYQPVPTSEFMNGFHGFPTRNGSTLLWTGDLGHPVTYGCVLVSNDNVEQLYNWADEGVIVEIQK